MAELVSWQTVFVKLLIGMAISLPLPVNAFSAFVGIDGRARSASEIHDSVTQVMQGAQVPGVALAMINRGEIVYQAGFGLRNKALDQPMTVNSVMAVASLTKTVSAYLVMRLVDDRVLDLDKPIHEYLPRPLPEYASWRDLAADPRYKLITTRMLLSHTAGFSNWRYFDPDHRLLIHYQPGTRYAYCGECFELLQLVMENVTKKPTEELMQERVFRPLGMTRTSLIWQSAFEFDYANGYDEYGRLLGHQRHRTAAAAGSLQTTVADYSKFLQAMLSGQGLSKEAHAQMLSTQIRIDSKFEFPTLLPDKTDEYKGIQLAYGLGVGLYQTPHDRAFFKEGHDEGWRSYFVCYQDAASCLLIMTNSSNGEGIYSALLKGLLGDTWNPIAWEVFTPYDQLPPRKPLSDHVPIQLPPAVLAMYAGRYGTGEEVLTIEQEANHLSVVENGRSKREFFPQTGSIYFSRTTDETLTFLFDIDSHAFRIYREVAGRREFLPNLEWAP
jgi:CubicO group peptidase (beta-lactamase class C family)